MKNVRTGNAGRMDGLQVNYRKSMEHYYLVLSQDKDTAEDYQMQMVLENRIRGLIPLEVKYREGRKDLYYDVSSLQPLTRIYDRRELSGAEIRRILYGIMDVLGEMHGYMLDEDSAILDPAYIFTDVESGEIRLMFLPKREGENEEEDPMLPVAEFLMEHADHRDPQAALCAYRVYQTIRKGNYVTEDLRRALEGKASDPAEKTCELPKLDTEIDEAEPGDPWPEICEEKKPADMYEELCEIPVAKRREITGKGKKTEERIPYILAAVLILIGALLLSGNIPGWYADSAGKLVAGVLMAAGAGVFVLQMRKGGGKKKKKELPASESLEDVFADMEPRMQPVADWTDRAEREDALFSVRAAEEDIRECDEEENYGKTVYIGAVDEPAENILVDQGKKKEYRIGHFPFTIGKMKDCVDLALTDRSVSRIHARILQKNGKTYLQDCRSTNGTYLNGVQLEAEETVMLEKEDEIGIGKVKLSYM